MGAQQAHAKPTQSRSHSCPPLPPPGFPHCLLGAGRHLHHGGHQFTSHQRRPCHAQPASQRIVLLQVSCHVSQVVSPVELIHCRVCGGWEDGERRCVLDAQQAAAGPVQGRSSLGCSVALTVNVW